MPSMAEIYEQYAKEYDELVAAEDYEENLPRALFDIVDWTGAEVIEAGTGTGRVTRLYASRARRIICCDRSQHMLDFSRNRLAKENRKIEFHIADNLEFPRFRDSDIFVEGWSFGHSVVSGADRVAEVAAVLISNAEKNLKPGGTAIIIETQGTLAEGAPHPALAEFYDLLENREGFTALKIRTDYRFPTPEDAARMTGFFFGPEMGEKVKALRSAVVPEWTGIWYRTKG